MLAEPIFLLIFPNASAGAPLLKVQCWMIVFAVLAQTLYGSLQGLGKLYIPGTCLAIGAVVKYILNVTLIPKYGEVIPAITTVIYNGIACTLSFILLFKYLKEKPDMKGIFLKPLFSTLVMCLGLYLFGKVNETLHLSNAIYTISSMLIGVIIYFISTFAVKTLSDEEIKQLPFGNKIYKFLRKN